jgi:hypothetical protein
MYYCSSARAPPRGNQRVSFARNSRSLFPSLPVASKRSYKSRVNPAKWRAPSEICRIAARSNAGVLATRAFSFVSLHRFPLGSGYRDEIRDNRRLKRCLADRGTKFLVEIASHGVLRRDFREERRVRAASRGMQSTEQ